MSACPQILTRVPLNVGCLQTEELDEKNADPSNLYVQKQEKDHKPCINPVERTNATRTFKAAPTSEDVEKENLI